MIRCDKYGRKWITHVENSYYLHITQKKSNILHTGLSIDEQTKEKSGLTQITFRDIRLSALNSG